MNSSTNTFHGSGQCGSSAIAILVDRVALIADRGRVPGIVAVRREQLVGRVIAVAGRGLTQTATGEVLGISQPKVTALLNGRLDGFSTDRLFRFLNALDCDVRITIARPHRKAAARVQVMAG